jgi:hypothetical protein
MTLRQFERVHFKLSHCLLIGLSRRDSTLLTVCFSIRNALTIRKSRRDDTFINQFNKSVVPAGLIIYVIDNPYAEAYG